MKETLRRIKLGQIQLFVNILDEYLSMIYLSALESVTSDETASRITIDIFTKLFGRIQNYKFWQDAEDFLTSSFEKLAKEYKISLNKVHFGKNNEVPSYVMRKVLMNLSAKQKSKKKRTIAIAVPAFLLMVAFTVTFILNVSSSVDFYPIGTIIEATNQPNLVYSKSYRSINKGHEFISFQNMIAVDDKHLLVKAFDTENDVYYEIYKHEKLVNTFRLEDNLIFLTAGNDKSLKFYDKEYVYSYDFEGRLIDRLLLTNNHIFSANKKYVAVEKNGYYIIYDLKDFSIIEETSSEISILSNIGAIISKDDLVKYGYDQYINNYDYNVATFIENEFLTIDNEGTLTIYHYGEAHLTTPLQYFTYMQDMDLYNDYTNHSFQINYNDSFIIIAIEGEEYSGFELICRKTGTGAIDIRDTLLLSRQRPGASISNDRSMFLLPTQTFIWNRLFRYNVVYDLTKTPLEAHVLDRGFTMRELAITGSNDIYYVYTIDNGGVFKIFEVLR